MWWWPLRQWKKVSKRETNKESDIISWWCDIKSVHISLFYGENVHI